MGLSQGKQGLVKVVDLRGHVVVHHHDLVGVHDFIGVQASAHIVSLDMGLNAEDGGDDPDDDGQTDRDSPVKLASFTSPVPRLT